MDWRHHFKTVLFACMLLSFQCAKESPVAGSGSETTNLVAKVVYENGDPVPFAKIVARPSDYVGWALPDSTVAKLRKDVIFAATDSLGIFTFDSSGNREFLVEASDNAGNAKALLSFQAAEDTLLLVLKQFGGIEVVLNPPTPTQQGIAQCHILGLEGFENDTNGVARFRNVPEGTYTVRIDFCRIWPSDYIWQDTAGIVVRAGEITSITGFSFLPRQTVFSDPEYIRDSLIVRAILDSNGISNSVQGYTAIRRNRIAVLFGGGITRLPKEIGQLEKLDRIMLFAPDSGLDTTGMTIPAEIANLPELLALRLPGQNLRTLPDNIVNLDKLANLDLSGNHLCNLPGEIAEWANTPRPFGPGLGEQICP